MLLRNVQWLPFSIPVFQYDIQELLCKSEFIYSALFVVAAAFQFENIR